MYDVRNKKESIRELNSYLLDIAYDDPRIPFVSLEPFFTSRTTEAVLAFQHAMGLDVSGIVDFDTWQALAERSKEIRKKEARERSLSIPSALPLSIGSVGHPVLMLQSTIGELGEYYDELPRVATTGSYRNGTAYAVSLLQRKYGLAETGITDPETWERIFRDAETRERLSLELNR